MQTLESQKVKRDSNDPMHDHGYVRNLFGPHRYKMPANDQRIQLISALEQWQDIVVQRRNLPKI